MRYSFLILAFGLCACGGGQPAEAPAGGAGEEPAGAAAEAEPGGADTAAGDEGASEDQSGGAAEEEPTDPNQFRTVDTHTAKDTHGVKKSNLEPTREEAHLKFVVVDKDKGAIPGIVVKLTDKEGNKFYTQETDAKGFAETLAPVGKKYDVIFVSLGGKDTAAVVDVKDEPRLTMKLTLRYKKWRPPPPKPRAARGFVLKGVNFDTGKATIRKDSYPRLESVIEYMTHKKSARILISGHTDNVGKKDMNKDLSTRRAKAVRAYLISKGIEGDRIEAIGYGDERPIAPNDSPMGRQRNRRIEAIEL